MLESLATIHYHRPKSQKRGRIRSLPLFFCWLKTGPADNSTWFSPRLSFLQACPASEPHPLKAHSVLLQEEPVPQVLQVQAAVVAALVLLSYRTRQMLA
jgi:hypothetical protein